LARWRRQNKQFVYVVVSDGEAGISTMDPSVVGPLRRGEQEASCAAVGVARSSSSAGPKGRSSRVWSYAADLAAAIRKHRPEVVVSINFRESWGGPSWNHADPRAVGRALLDAVRDAANPWVFPDRGDPWPGVRFVAFSGSPQPTHAVDTTATFDDGVRSLACHRTYLANLEG
jgi:LmbE family N-acetylglucosaminyl deacetylase